MSRLRHAPLWRASLASVLGHLAVLAALTGDGGMPGGDVGSMGGRLYATLHVDGADQRIGDPPHSSEATATPPAQESEGVGMARSSGAPVAGQRQGVFPLDPSFAPFYPLPLLNRQVGGHVTVRLRLDGEGRAQDVEIIDSVPAGAFDESVMTALESMRMKPPKALRNQSLQVTVIFDPFSLVSANAQAKGRAR